MVWQWLFAPVFVSLDEEGREQFDPGYLDGGDIVSALALLPPRTSAPVCDKAESRFVMRVDAAWSAPDGWIPTTLAEVAALYPGRV